MELRNTFIILMVIAILAIKAIGQGVCVPDALRVNSISGKVMSHFDKGDESLQNVIIKITKRNNHKKVIKEILTDESGFFEFKDIKKGNYTLIASYPKLKDFYLDLLVSSKNTSENKQIILWFGADFLKPCSGSYAELKEK